MSESISRLNLVKVSDARISDVEKKTYLLVEGGQVYTRRFFGHSSISTSSLSFNNINPPDLKTYVSKYITITHTWVVNLVGSNSTPGSNLLGSEWSHTMSLRALPLMNSFTSMSLQINNATFNQDMNDVLPYFERCRFNKMSKDISYSPTYLDSSQRYSELCQPATVRNPLGPYGTSIDGTKIARGGFPQVVFSNITATTTDLTITVTEPIMISPLAFNNNDEPYFSGVQSMFFNAVYDSNSFARLFSISDLANGVTLTSNVVTPMSATMNFTYVTASITTNIPKTLVFPYYNVNRYVTDYNGGALVPTLTKQSNFVLNNIQISSIPKRLVLFVKQKRSSLTASSPDVFARIDKINIDFMNRSSLLASANVQQLFDMSKFNGLDMQWEEFFGGGNPGNGSVPGGIYQSGLPSGIGSVIIIEPAMDLGLDNLGSAGMSLNTQLAVTLDFTNLSLVPLSFSAYLLTIDDGLITINNGATYVQNSVVGVNDLLNIAETPTEYTTSEALIKDMNGGDFFGNIKNFIQRNLPLFKQIFEVGKTVAPLVAPLLGLGYSGGARAMRRGRGVSGGGVSGGGLVGGAKLDRLRLKNLM